MLLECKNPILKNYSQQIPNYQKSLLQQAWYDWQSAIGYAPAISDLFLHFPCILTVPITWTCLWSCVHFLASASRPGRVPAKRVPFFAKPRFPSSPGILSPNWHWSNSTEAAFARLNKHFIWGISQAYDEWGFSIVKKLPWSCKSWHR